MLTSFAQVRVTQDCGAQGRDVDDTPPRATLSLKGCCRGSNGPGG